MSIYGLIIKNAAGDAVKITPDVANIISVGQVTMPSGLVDTDKYYASVDLPGTAAIPIDNIGCVMDTFSFGVALVTSGFDGTSVNGWYRGYIFAPTGIASYTKNLDTGVMTPYTAGNCTDITNVNNWDPVLALYSDVYWDKFADTTVTAIKIFASMRYHVYDGSASAIVDAYEPASISKVDYAISMRRVV